MSLPFSLDWWDSASHGFIRWFSSPSQVLLPLAGAAIATSLIRRDRHRRRLLLGFLTLTCMYLTLISPLGAALAVQSLVAPLPADRGQTADAIVILGRGNLAEHERAQLAAHLWQSGRAPVILATGRGEAPRLVNYLSQAGVASKALISEPWARSTEENALYSVPLLRQLAVRHIILITDQPHMLRSLLTFRSFGFEVVPHPVVVPDAVSAIDVTTLALREYGGLLIYGLLGRFHHRPQRLPSMTDTKSYLYTPGL